MKSAYQKRINVNHKNSSLATQRTGASSDSDIASYVEKQIIPWLTEHLRMRSVGFQVFPAVQATVFIAYGQLQDQSIPILGLVLCIVFVLWDVRNINIFIRLHRLAQELQEDKLLEGKMDGLHAGATTIIQEGLFQYGFRKVFSNLGSHTVAIFLMVFATMVLWARFLITGPPSMP